MPPDGSSTAPSTSAAGRGGGGIRLTARLYRILRGMHAKRCPGVSFEPGRCYWCNALLYAGMTYLGNEPGRHQRGCPWAEYVAMLPTLEAIEGEPVYDPDQADPPGGG